MQATGAGPTGLVVALLCLLHGRYLRGRHFDVLALLLLACAGTTIAVPLTLELFLVEVNVVLFDMYDGLAQQAIGFPHERRCDLHTTGQCPSDSGSQRAGLPPPCNLHARWPRSAGSYFPIGGP